jgi:glycopeptide antibiotics resistance protein
VTGVWHAWGSVILVSLVGLPLAGAVAWVLARSRPARPARYAFAEVFIVAGTVPWLWMILTPDPSGTRRVSLVPLRDLLTLAPGDLVVQIGGNLLVFAAAGFLLPVRWPVGIGTVLLLAAGASTLVEIAQYALDLGRVSSVDDVLLNALGAGLAAAAAQPLWRRSRQVNDALATG